MDHSQGEKINIAGYPKQVIAGEPPFWRYRITDSGKEIGVRDWRITGAALPGNNWQGVELGASFLLWWGLYGRLHLEGDTAVIELLPNPHSGPILHQETAQSFFNVPCRVYANPKRVGGLTPPFWFLRLDGNDYEVSRFTVEGVANQNNISPGIDLNAAEITERLWLNFKGDVHLDNHQHARIELNS